MIYSSNNSKEAVAVAYGARLSVGKEHSTDSRKNEGTGCRWYQRNQHEVQVQQRRGQEWMLRHRKQNSADVLDWKITLDSILQDYFIVRYFTSFGVNERIETIVNDCKVLWIEFFIF